MKQRSNEVLVTHYEWISYMYSVTLHLGLLINDSEVSQHFYSINCDKDISMEVLSE